MLVVGLYSGNVAVFNLQVRISTKVGSKTVSSEEHFEAQLHLLRHERKAPGAGLAGYKTTICPLQKDNRLASTYIFVQFHIFQTLLMPSILKQVVVCGKTTFDSGEVVA